MEPFIVFDHVSLSSGERLAFEQTDWIIQRGEQWAILGSNASGKSLLGRALTGAVRVTRGEILYPFAAHSPATANGRPLAAPEQAVMLMSAQTHREALAQESSFYQSRWHSGLGQRQKTVAQFLSQECIEGANPYEVNPRLGCRRGFGRKRSELVAELGIRPLLRRKLPHLSNGEMRKVLLVGALLRFPQVLVLDDPYAGLDVRTRHALGRLINRWMAAGLKVIVIVSRVAEIPARASHLMLVHDHRVIAQGPKRQVLAHPLAKALCANITAARRGKPSNPQLPKTGRKLPRAKPLVAMKNVSVNFGRKVVLQQVTWTMHRGEHWALLGANGAGKSTLLSLIQVDNPQVYAQDITLFGLRPDSTQALWRARQRLGWVSPELHLHYPPEWSCLDVVCSGFTDSIGLHQACSLRQRRQARHWIRALHLDQVAGKNLGELSTGEQRMVLLARAMVKRPQLLILDEPCQGLDRAHRELILNAADKVVRDTGAHLIFVTHHADEMPRCITHVLRLRGGRVIEQGPVR